MSTVSVRYIVNDVDAAIAFDCEHLGFEEVMHPAPTFAMLSSGDLRLVLTAAGGGPGGGQAMPDGSLPKPGGWNRFTVEVADLEVTVETLRTSGAHFRNDIVTGVGGKQILLEDPSGNPVELFEPILPEAALSIGNSYELVPIGFVESSLIRLEDAPCQGEGAPPAWLVFDSFVEAGIADVHVGEELIVLTWLDRAQRDELRTYPEDDESAGLFGILQHAVTQQTEPDWPAPSQGSGSGRLTHTGRPPRSAGPDAHRRCQACP